MAAEILGRCTVRAPKKSRAKALQAALDRVEQDEELREKLKKAQEDVFLYDLNAPSVRARRESHTNEFTYILRGLLTSDNTLPRDVTNEAVYRHCFTKDHLVSSACQYLAFIATDPVLSKGLVGPKMRADSLRPRVSSLWFKASWELGSDAATVFPIWTQTTEALVHKLAVEHDFSTEHRTKNFFGVPELRLLFHHLWQRTQRVDWWKQMFLAWALTFMTGVRPGSLGVTWHRNGTATELQQCLRWRDVEFIPNLNGQGLAVRVTIKWLKGHRDRHLTKNRQAKTTAQFLIVSCKTVQTLCNDVPWMMFCVAFERRLFGRQATVDELLSSTSTRMFQDDEITHHPVFLSQSKKKGSKESLTENEGLLAYSFNAPLQTACRAASIAARASMYCWRREFVSFVGRIANPTLAKEFASHAPARSEAYGAYDYGLGDHDIASIRLAEGPSLEFGIAVNEVRRNEMREWLNSPALNRRRPFSGPETAKQVAERLQEDDDVKFFHQASTIIMEAVKVRYDLNGGLKFDLVESALKTLVSNDEQNTTLDEQDCVAIDAVVEDVYDHGAWTEAFTNSNANDNVLLRPSSTLIFFQAFRLARKNFLRRLRNQLKKDVTSTWIQEAARRPATLTEIDSNRALIMRPPSVFDGPKHRTREGTVTAPPSKRSKTQLAPQSNGINDTLSAPVGTSDDEDEGEDDQLDEVVEARVVADEQAEESYDTWLESSEANPATLMPRDEDSRIEKDVDINQGRRQLIDAWLELKDINRSHQACPLCKSAVSRPCPKEFPSAFTLAQHLVSDAHTTHLEYDHWCEEEGDEEGSPHWHCHLCSTAYCRASALNRHLKKSHASLWNRL